MFDITSDDISQLNDIDLRELIGRVCEAELVSRGLSPAAVTWGGSQTAADGGLDVRVELPAGVSIEGFIPCRSTGFQVKTPDMPRAAILAEMRPAGAIRPVIQELADTAGAYVIVSSKGSTADSALRRRRNALREALDGISNADQLRTDFYDRTRLATWVRRHAGLTTWVKEKVGRSFVGWRPYGPWSGVAEGVDAEYLLDSKLRLQFSGRTNAPSQSVVHAIDELRDELAQPGTMVRLVGLSGVGKTRLVQALFDARVGSRPLPPSLAVYTNLSDNPDPQPTGLVSDLIANRTRAVLIVDNCPPDLHRGLSDLCRGHNSTVSVITVEYDVRDDQPEGTQVVTLDTSSPELIEKLVLRRYGNISEVDARTIAKASGGNARIAIALAETVERSDTIAGLSNDELFERLFRQRQDANNALLLAAQACSLVYSFQGEALKGEYAELPRLALLAGQAASETYRHVGELLRRDLVQRRGVWRAVLPQAVANRLAARALEDTPYDLINQQIVEGGCERLAQSFSRRLSFLHDHPRAVAIVREWLTPHGLLGNVTALNHHGQAMFENVAPVIPDATLGALERAATCDSAGAAIAWHRHLSLLRSLAYDPLLFERSTDLLARVVTQSTNPGNAKSASDAFVSLFKISLSGTRATIEQRLGVIERLLRSAETKARTLGLAALEQVLETTHFSSSRRFDFGARPRDYGYQPRTRADVTQWFGAAFTVIERLALADRELKPQLLALLARKFRGLWRSAHVHEELDNLFRRFAVDGFWNKGWTACQHTMYFDRDLFTAEVASRLSALEAALRPSNLPDRVRAMVLADATGGLDLIDIYIDEDSMTGMQRLDAIARALGAAVAADGSVFAELLPEILRGGNRAREFGRGLARASSDPRAIWQRIAEGLEHIAPEQRDVQVLWGFLAELSEQDGDLAQHLLDSAFGQPALQVFLPALHSIVGIDECGVESLSRALSEGKTPVWAYRYLAFGSVTARLSGAVLGGLILKLADRPDGFNVALEILAMRLHSDRSAQIEHEPELLDTARKLLQHVTFGKRNPSVDHQLAEVARACLTAPGAGPVVTEVVTRLKQAVASYKTSGSDNVQLLEALFQLQPVPVLGALFDGEENDEQVRLDVLENGRDNPADAISREVLISWCEGDREHRYSLAASIITFAVHSEETGFLVWSDQARALLVGAPDPESVLSVFVKRFRPNKNRWSGSRAALTEANARLLDVLEFSDSTLMPFVIEARAQLAREVARERQQETQQERARNERFE